MKNYLLIILLCFPLIAGAVTNTAQLPQYEWKSVSMQKSSYGTSAPVKSYSRSTPVSTYSSPIHTSSSGRVSSYGSSFHVPSVMTTIVATGSSAQRNNYYRSLNIGSSVYSSKVYVPQESVESDFAMRRGGRPESTTEEETTTRPTIVPLGDVPMILILLLSGIFAFYIQHRARKETPYRGLM